MSEAYFLVDLGFGPDEGAGSLVVVGDEGVDVPDESFHDGEGLPVDRLAGQHREPDFDLVEPGGVGRGVVVWRLSHMSRLGLWVERLSRTTWISLEIALGAFERLNGRLLIDREHDGVVGRGHVEADDLGRLGREFGVGADAPRFAAREVYLVRPQEAPDILDVNVAQPGRLFRDRGDLSPSAAATSTPCRTYTSRPGDRSRRRPVRRQTGLKL
jgi:hypothetical protein